MKMSGFNLFAAACVIALGGAAACGDYSSSDESHNIRSRDSGMAGRPATPEAVVGRTSYVGMRYAALPSGFSYEAGSTISRGSGGASQYAVSRVRTPRGDMLWLETIGPHDGRGAAERVVRAELRVPPLAADERLMIGSCDVNGRLDARVVAIVVADSGVTRLTKIRQAWRAELQAGRFDLLPVADIVCEDPGS
ncbi:MAG TPA: hypothetical protein VLN49_13745 [Gemmatimonadaceae bacterium]|nr:hypothetical protein [Gemmatimonadaceae bacterium]